MAKKEQDSRLKGFPKKWANVLAQPDHDEWLDKAQQASKDDLEKMIVQSSELLADFKKDLESDQDIKDIKEQLKDACHVPRQGIKINEAKAMYCVYLKKSM